MNADHPQTGVAKVWQRVVDRESARIRDAFLREADPRPSGRTVLAYLLAGAVLALGVALLALGVWFALRAAGPLAPELTVPDGW
jgi:hypothetical protein